MEGRKDVGWVYDDIPLEGDGPTSIGKRKLIRGGGSNPRVSNVTRPHDPGGGGGGGGMADYPVSVNGRTTDRKSSWKIVKGRYGKPVLTPIWGTDVTESRYTDVIKPQEMTTAEYLRPKYEVET